MRKLKLFEVAMILHPAEETTDKSKMIGEIKRMLAADEKQVAMLAAREIPEEYLSDLDRVEVLVRPF